MRETKIESLGSQFVQDHGGVPYKFTSPGYRNVPDRMNLFPGGRTLFIEYKATGEKPRPGQLRELERLNKMGFTAVWVDSIEAARAAVLSFLKKEE